MFRPTAGAIFLPCFLKKTWQRATQIRRASHHNAQIV